MILAHLIERITVDRYYNITIKFFITKEEFLQGRGDGVIVQESDHIVYA